MESSTTPAQTVALVERGFTIGGPDFDPFDAVEWERRDAWPSDMRYWQPEIEVPKDWVQEALDIASKLYLAKGDYSEDSIRTLIKRVAGKISSEGIENSYFEIDSLEVPSGEHESREAQIFYDELRHVLVHQLAAFNSPVWFNVGRPDRKQQVSACFILSVDDDTDSIMETATREAYIFKGGSGSGFNVSRLRGSMEPLSTGGTASGPVSFMRLWDADAGTFKSGGTTRRAAKLVRMDCDHPDIIDFIECKVREERRLLILAKAGINVTMDLEGERNVAEVTSFQNANNSVGVSDDFMAAATLESGSSWPLRSRVNADAILDHVDAREMLDKISEAAWECGDPGLQYDSTINRWHTTPFVDGKESPIRSSNPCGEYLSNDDTSCNLASINMLKFVREDGVFDVDGYRQAVDVMITAMDILVSFADYPDEKIAEMTRRLRQLGLGYSNMGAAIMAQGMPYDSDEARDFAAAATALLTGRGYRKSAQLAQKLGTFDCFDENRGAMLAVINAHIDSLPRDGTEHSRSSIARIWEAACEDWAEAEKLGQQHGYRNAQISVIPPAGTTSYLLGCDTTGIEPAFMLVTHKELAGGGSMKLVNKSVERGLRSLGYDERVVRRCVEHLAEVGYLPTTMAIDDEPIIRNEQHAAVFHNANEISAEGHVRMVAAVQPFVSGGISKTVNLSEDSPPERVRDLYKLAWELGVKCMSLYRNRSKVRQVLMDKPKQIKVVDVIEQPRPQRRRLPRDANMLRHKFIVGDFEGYLLIGLYEDGSPGEIFLEDLGKDGSHVRGMTNAWAIAMSHLIQYGMPLEKLVRKYVNMNFEPHGRTECPEIPAASSLVDYIARFLALKFLPEMHHELGVLTDEVKAQKVSDLDLREAYEAALENGPDGPQIDNSVFQTRLFESMSNGNGIHAVGSLVPVGAQVDGPPCNECGGVMFRAGSCWQCRCGNSTGCG